MIISLAIVAFLFYQYMSRSMTPNEDLGIQEGDTIIDTVNYARDATRTFELDNCLRACSINLDNIENCQIDCEQKYN